MARIVRGADAFGAVAGADLALARGGALGVLFRAFGLVEACAQHLHRFCLVLVLRFLVLDRAALEAAERWKLGGELPEEVTVPIHFRIRD